MSLPTSITSIPEPLTNVHRKRLDAHRRLSLLGSYLTECPVKDASSSCQSYRRGKAYGLLETRKDIDGAVILSLIHGKSTLKVTDVLVASLGASERMLVTLIQAAFFRFHGENRCSEA